jgi:hypothetical protein
MSQPDLLPTVSVASTISTASVTGSTNTTSLASSTNTVSVTSSTTTTPEVNELKTLNEELEKRVAASELSNVTLTKKKEELVQEVINIVNKANDQRGKIKIEYDNLVKAVAERDTRITLQEQHIKELKQLML